MTGQARASGHDLASAYAHCAEVARRRARNFYYGLRLTPEPRRSAIYSVYAWMRLADDEADRAGDPTLKREEMASFREAAERMLAGRELGERERDPVWVAFRETVRRYSIDPADLRGMLDGLEADLEHEVSASGRSGHGPAMMCRTREDLRLYCYRVASTVGLVCITIWGLRPSADRKLARALAVRRGLAFQLTNILRDYAQDYDEGRVYLPEESLRRAGVTPEGLRAWAEPGPCRSVVEEIARWARGEYESSAPLDDMIDPSCYAALRTMTRIYAGLLALVEAEPSRIVGRRRIRLPSARKAGIALRAYLRGVINTHRAVPGPAADGIGSAQGGSARP